MDDAEIFILTDDQGKEHEYRELFSFDSEDFHHSYIILEPVLQDEAEVLDLLPFVYDKNVDEGMLQPIETTQEFDMIEEVMNTIFNDPSLR